MTSLKQETPAPTRKLQSLVYSFLQIQLSPQSQHHKIKHYYFIFPSKFPTQNGGSQLNTTLIGEYDVQAG